MKSTTLKLIKKIAERQVEKDQKSWPPDCLGFFHQPVRPTKTEKKN